jgi:hypothetical protein
MARAALLMQAMDDNHARVRDRLEGMDEEEFFWKPVPEAWTIFHDGTGRWRYDYAIPDPEPARVTTIAWQMIHLGTCKVMYHEYAYGPARLRFPEIDIPRTPVDTIAFLDDGQQLLGGDLEGLTETGLDELVKTNWGELWPAWRIFWVMADHDAFHGGMIGTLRDLYQWRTS